LRVDQALVGEQAGEVLCIADLEAVVDQAHEASVTGAGRARRRL
jgi:hypothetical protein